MAEIRVTSSQLRDTGRRISSQNNQANSYLDQIADSINRLRNSGSGGWDSPGAQAFFAKFDELRGRINRHRNVIDQYSRHLDTAAGEYERSDAHAEREASTINVRRG